MNLQNIKCHGRLAKWIALKPNTFAEPLATRKQGTNGALITRAVPTPAPQAELIRKGN